jgi:small conductance mechanosensitive channel
MPLLLETPTPTPAAPQVPVITAVSPVEFWSTVSAAVLPMAVPAVEAIVVAVATIALARRLRDLARRSLTRAGADLTVILLVGQLTYFAVICLGAIWVLAIFSVPPAGLVAAFGAAGLAFGLSLQDLLRNLIAGLYLLVEKPFRPGERLMVRTFEGTVSSVDLRTTTLLTPQGERVLVPNAILFAEVLVNRGAPRPLMEMDQAEEGPVG